MTGQEFFKHFKQDIGLPYTGSIDTIKANPLFRKALLNVVENNYQHLITQKEFDQLKSVIVLDRIVAISGNSVLLNTLQIINLTIGGIPLPPAPQLVPITVTTFYPHKLDTGEFVTLSSIAGFTSSPPINGVFVVTKIDDFKFTISVTSISGAYTASSGFISHSKILTDYYHLLTVKAKYEIPVKTSIQTFTTASHVSTPMVMKLLNRTNLRSGEKVIISSVAGSVAANGIRYIKALNDFDFALYSDKDLSVPVISFAAYTFGGALSRVFYNAARPIRSSQKGSSFVADHRNPTVETGDLSLKFTPEGCKEITIDYMKTPKLFIDTSDNIIDLLLYYPEKFLYLIQDEAGKLLSETFRDTELTQSELMEIKQNP